MKKIFANALLELLKEKRLKKITVGDLLEYTGAGRQTFYRHFRDRNDLFQYIYLHYIHHSIVNSGLEIDAMYGRESTYRQFMKYKDFLAQACEIGGQNNLRDYMVEYFVKWYVDGLRNRYNYSDIPDDVMLLIKFTGYGAINMIIEWVQNGCTIEPEKYARMIADVYSPKMHELFLK